MALKETIQEFKEFAIKGNVVDMAVGVIIGGAFGKIVTSFVNDLIMPIIGKLTGGADFSQLYLPLDGNHYATLADAQAATATIAYGSFLTQVLDFLEALGFPRTFAYSGYYNTTFEGAGEAETPCRSRRRSTHNEGLSLLQIRNCN